MRKTTSLMVIVMIYFALIGANLIPLSAEVANSTTPAKGEWDFKLQKEWEIIKVKDDVLAYVPFIWVDEQGKIYVFDRKLTRFYIFGPQGKLLNSFGKKGEGPGELSWPRQFFLEGKFIIVMDRGMVKYFARDGKFIKSINLGGRFEAKAFLDENRFATIRTIYADEVQVGKLEVLDLRTQERSLVAEVAPDKMLTAKGSSRRILLKDPAITTAIIVGTDGKSLIFGSNDSYTFKQTDLTGKVLNTFSIKEKKPRKMTREMKIKKFNRLPDEVLKEIIKQVPDYTTYYRRILVDDTGMIYIFLTDVSNETGWEIDIFSPGGKYLYHANITLQGLKPVEKVLAIKGNSLVTFVEDEEGEVKLVKYKITKPGI